MSSDSETVAKDEVAPAQKLNGTSSSSCWPEVAKALESKRYELCLVGPDIKKRIESNNGLLDSHLFKLKHLNFLEIAKTSLRHVPVEIGLLESLAQFICHSNELDLVPEGSLSRCSALKNLDLSNNKLTKLPADLQELKELTTINLSGNQLTSLFPMTQLGKLAVLDVSSNHFEKLPDDICSESLENLAQINASLNKLVELPNELNNLPSLKLLNVENNQIAVVPASLSQCIKLKDLLLKENKLKDNRLKKLVDQNKAKAIVEYLERIYVEESKKAQSTKKTPAQSAESKSKKKAAEQATEYDLIKVMHVNNLKDSALNGREVQLNDNLKGTRPFIICAIVRNLDLDKAGVFKKFLTIQTKIQDETCQKRSLATIATHDLKSIKGNMVYECADATHILFVPLGRKNPVTALAFYEKLVEEAEAERKLKKRNLVSGIYKYLSLVEDQTKFPYLKDESNATISLPPLSNSETTKISPSSKDILIEITSSANLDICKQVMNELLTEMLKNGITSTSDEANNALDAQMTEMLNLDEQAKPRGTLLVQQVKIVDEKRDLRWVYPSRVDLDFSAAASSPTTRIQVVRLYDD